MVNVHLFIISSRLKTRVPFAVIAMATTSFCEKPALFVCNMKETVLPSIIVVHAVQSGYVSGAFVYALSHLK